MSEVVLRELLNQIRRGEGAYSRDHLTHAENCIKNMRNLAAQALAILEGKTLVDKK